MSKKQTDMLRMEAEAKLSHAPPTKAPPLSAEKLLHELQVHQVELAMQNEELRNAHISLEKSRDRYIDLYEFAPVGYITINRAELVVEINLTGCALLGVDRSKLINRRFAKFVSNHDIDRWHRLFVNMMEQAEGMKQTFDLEIIRADGSTFYAHLDCRPREVVDAQLVLRFALVDISELKLAEAKFNLMQYAAIIESSDDAIIGVTLEGIITSWNGGAEQMFGYSSEEVKGLHVSLLFPEQYKHEEAMLLERIRKGVSVKHYETVRRCKDGKLIDVSVTLSPLRDQDGNIVGASKVARDIAERKKADAAVRLLNAELEQRVAQRTAQLEAANKELEEFSYSMSHDMRTPLRALDGFSKILLEEHGASLDDEGKRLANVLRNNAQRMGRLIDDILHFLSMGRRRMEFSFVDIAKLASEIFAELQAAAPARCLRLEIGTLPPAWGDRDMLREVLHNLLSNAVKFSPTDGEVLIKLGGAVEKDENVYSVTDLGVGFDMHYADKLFRVFERVHSTGQYEGSGIGLALVKRIVSRHGGRVWAEGKVNEGATIYFALPAPTLT